MNEIEREVLYRQMVRRIEETVRGRSPWYARKPTKLTQEQVVRFARTLVRMADGAY